MKKIEIEEQAKNLVVDPESYNAYIKRQNNHRNIIAKGSKREKSLPGSGNVWTKKVTKPQEFNLVTEGNGSNKSFQIKSLTKVEFYFFKNFKNF